MKYKFENVLNIYLHRKESNRCKFLKKKNTKNKFKIQDTRYILADSI